MPTFSDDKGKDMDPMGDLLGEFMERNKLNLRYMHGVNSYDEDIFDEDAMEEDGELTMDFIRQVLEDEEAEFTLTLEDEEGEETDFSLDGMLEIEDTAYLFLSHFNEEEDSNEILFARCDVSKDGAVEIVPLEEGEELSEVQEAFEAGMSGEGMTPVFTFVDEDGNEETVTLINVLETDEAQYGVLMYEDEDGVPEVRFVYYQEDEDGMPEIAEIEDEIEYAMVDRLYEESVRASAEDDEEDEDEE